MKEINVKAKLGLWTFIATVVSCLSTAATLDAQWYSGRHAGLGYGYAVPYGYGGYGMGQTPMSANAIGMSSLVRSQGQYNEQTSKAMINYEQARSQYIDNQQKAYATRQTVLRAGNARVAEELAADQASVARANEFLAAHQPLPLPNSQLSLSTGHIEWPVALATPDFADSRKSIEGLFESRVKSGATASLSTQIERKTTEMKDLLRDQITKIPLTDYSEARRFLDSMMASAR